MENHGPASAPNGAMRIKSGPSIARMRQQEKYEYVPKYPLQGAALVAVRNQRM